MTRLTIRSFLPILTIHTCLHNPLDNAFSLVYPLELIPFFSNLHYVLSTSSFRTACGLSISHEYRMTHSLPSIAKLPEEVVRASSLLTPHLELCAHIAEPIITLPS